MNLSETLGLDRLTVPAIPEADSSNKVVGVVDGVITWVDKLIPDLTDNANKVLTVNSDASNVEWVTPSGSASFNSKDDYSIASGDLIIDGQYDYVEISVSGDFNFVTDASTYTQYKPQIVLLTIDATDRVITWKMNNNDNTKTYWTGGTTITTTANTINRIQIEYIGNNEWNITNLDADIKVDGGGYSDTRLKDNKKLLINSLSKIESLNGITFDWNDKSGIRTEPGLGVVAQDVELVFPELVGEKNGFKTVHYELLVAPLIEAVKELTARVRKLENNQ